jgi:hypothetical protein
MSSPFVAGTCALLAQLHPDWTRSEMLARIESFAVHVNADGRAFGAGALDVGAALAPDAPVIVIDTQGSEDLRPH